MPARPRLGRNPELTRTDRLVGSVLAVAGAVPALALGFIAYEMLREAYPAIVFNGGHFFTGRVFSYGNLYSSGVEVRDGYRAAQGAHFAILPMIFGTFASSLIALVLAVPVAVGGAILLVEKIPSRLQGPLGTLLELLAAIPSVVFGLWGVYTFGPLLSRTVFKWIAALRIPWLDSHVGHGEGLLTASLVLAVMIVPIVASIARELVRAVPAISKEGAAGLGLTAAETVRVVTLPFVRTGVVAAAILGWGRALGETIAVLLISGATLNSYPHSIFDTFTTMAATIAAILDGALTDATRMGVHALAETGLVLLAISILTNFAGRMVARRLSDAALPVGRGV